MSHQATQSPSQQHTEPNPGRVIELGLGFWGSKALLTAVELGVFTELAQNGPLDADTLRERVGIHTRSARDFFDALVALGVLERGEEGYANTTETALFLDRNSPTYVGGMLEMANARLYGSWGQLTAALRTGLPHSDGETGQEFFETLYSDGARLRQFMRSMTGLSTGAAQAIAAKFPWHQHETLADIGTAEGGVPVAVASTHAHVTGTGFDLPPVGPVFDEYVAANGLTGRLRFQGGDFFTDPLPQADVLVMGHILHDWNLEEKRTLIDKAYAALPDGGALIVFDAIIDDDRCQNAFGLLMSLNMLVELPGGFDYTGADCQGWLRDAGFASTYVEHLAGPDSMVVGIK
jgi:hypothetical protein